jgi:AcrR family transcriptional regulator
MATSDRRARHKLSLRREILEAASRLFVEEGFQRLTMRRIAERIEYSPTTIYLHFKDKNELLAAVCQETFAQLTTKIERIRRSAPTPMAYLREGLRTYVEFGLAHPDQYVVTFMVPAPAMPGSSPGHSIGQQAFETLRAGVRACAEHGDIQTGDIEATAQALWAAVHGVTSLLISTKGFPFVSQSVLVDHVIDTALAGLKAPPSAPRSAVTPQSKKWNYFD